AELSGLELPAGLKSGKDRRQWLSDPSHKHVFHFTPVHGSWLNQVEMFFSVLTRKLLRRDDFASAAAFAERLGQWLDYYSGPWRTRMGGPGGARRGGATRGGRRRGGSRGAAGPSPARGRSASSACSTRLALITRRQPATYPDHRQRPAQPRRSFVLA